MNLRLFIFFGLSLFYVKADLRCDLNTPKLICNCSENVEIDENFIISPNVSEIVVNLVETHTKLTIKYLNSPKNLSKISINGNRFLDVSVNLLKDSLSNASKLVKLEIKSITNLTLQSNAVKVNNTQVIFEEIGNLIMEQASLTGQSNTDVRKHNRNLIRIQLIIFCRCF